MNCNIHIQLKTNEMKSEHSRSVCSTEIYSVSHEYNLKFSRNILKKEKAGEINFNLI